MTPHEEAKGEGGIFPSRTMEGREDRESLIIRFDILVE